MPYKTTFENDGAKVMTRYSGAITMSDVYTAIAERNSDIAKMKKFRVVISDFTDVTESVADELDIQKLVQLFKQATTHNPDIAYVGIMPTDLQYGIGRMWEAYFHDAPLREKIVRTREEAQAFLDEAGL